LPLFHFDLYRINSEEEVNDLGLWEQLLDERALRLVEWPEHAPRLKHYADFHLNFSLIEAKRYVNFI
jgi:tRNA threonylcarbamoyladenosine biosynthesis protein TsaE